MGGSCSLPMEHEMVDKWAHLASTAEVRNAVLSIEKWQKAQETQKASGGIQGGNSGSLLNRMGGSDVVKRIVEAFYRKLYSDEKLLSFLHDKEVTYLRAKQSAFMSWLFGPAHQPYTGKHLRTAHLRLIRQRGFSADDFERGLMHFEDAMKELGAPENLCGEVMAKVRPFKEVIFTPSPKDAEEEARWLAEERTREIEQRFANQGSKRTSRQPSKEQLPASQPVCPAASAAAPAVTAAAAPAPAAAGAAAAGPAGGNSGSNSRPASSSRGPQCPFTGFRVSRPPSAAASDAAPAADPTALGLGVGSASKRVPPVPPLPLNALSRPTSRPASRPASQPVAPSPSPPPVGPPGADAATDPNGSTAAPPLPPQASASASAAPPPPPALSASASSASGGVASPAAGPSPRSSSRGEASLSSPPLSAAASSLGGGEPAVRPGSAGAAAATSAVTPSAASPYESPQQRDPEPAAVPESTPPPAPEGDDEGAVPEGGPAVGPDGVETLEGPAEPAAGAEDEAEGAAAGRGAADVETEGTPAAAAADGDAAEDIVDAFMSEVAEAEARAA